MDTTAATLAPPAGRTDDDPAPIRGLLVAVAIITPFWYGVYTAADALGLIP
ncbi:hypothetical protein ACWEQ4_00985 [Rhodococcus sp. NPDC003994]